MLKSDKEHRLVKKLSGRWMNMVGFPLRLSDITALDNSSVHHVENLFEMVIFHVSKRLNSPCRRYVFERSRM
jgi:hypothetical protein